MIVYVATNTVNDMQYVGVTRRKSITRRITEHFLQAKSKKPAAGSFQEAILEYGETNIKFEIIDKVETLSQLDRAERHWIAELNTIRPHGYNIASGGISTNPHWMFNNKLYEVDGKKYYGMQALADAYGASAHNLRWRILRSPEPWTIKQALGLEAPPPFDPLRNFNKVTVNGKSFKSCAAAARKYGIDIKKFRHRLWKGWSPEEALEIQPREKPFTDPQAKQITVQGKTFRSIRKAAEHYGINCYSVYQRITYGWTVEQALQLEPRKTNYRPPQNIAGYSSITAAAKAHGIKLATLSYRLRSGWTIEQALKIQPQIGSNQNLRKSNKEQTNGR